jgi:hypothetical protein
VLAPRGTYGNRAAAIAVAGDVALAAWIENSATGFRVMARRISSAGFVYYESAITIAVEPTQPLTHIEDVVAVASDGTQFLVAWSGSDNQIHAARVDAATGVVLDTPSLTVSRQAEPRFGIRNSVTAVWTGEFFYVAWLDDPRNPLLLSPPVPPITLVHRALVRPNGSLVTTQDSQELHRSSGQPRGLTATYVNGVHLLAWSQESNGTCVKAMPVRDSGILLPPVPATLRCFASSSGVSVPNVASTSTTNGFTIAWEERSTSSSDIHATRLNLLGQLVTAAPIRVVVGGQQPALTSSGEVATIAYSRPVSTSTGTLVNRVFVDTVPDMPAAAQRSRAIRRR